MSSTELGVGGSSSEAYHVRSIYEAGTEEGTHEYHAVDELPNAACHVGFVHEPDKSSVWELQPS